MERKDKEQKNKGAFVLIFHANMTVRECVASAMDSVKIIGKPSENFFYKILNDFLSQMYSVFIRDVRICKAQKTGQGIYKIVLEDQENGSYPRVCEIIKVMAGEDECDRVGRDYPKRLASDEKKYTFDEDGSIILFGKDLPDVLDVFYMSLPIKYTSESSDVPMPFPEDFTQLCILKMTAEAYRECSEPELCAEASSAFNSMLETFKMWLGHTERRG